MKVPVTGRTAPGSWRVRSTGILGRLLVLALLLLAARETPLPPWLEGIAQRGAEPVDLVLLEDVSVSAARRGAAEAGRRVASLLDTLPRGSRLHHVRFGAGAALVPARAPGPHRSDLSGALSLALSLPSSPGTRQIAIVSDGELHGDDPGPSLRVQAETGWPAHWLDLRTLPALPGAWLSAVHAPRRISGPGSVAVRIRLGARGVDTVRLRLWLGGRLVTDRPVAVGDGGDTEILESVVLERPGDWRLRARVDAAGDAIVGDDEREIPVRVDGAAPVLWTSAAADSPLAAALAAGGWPLRRLRPEALADALDATPAVVILENVSAPALGDAGQAALWSAVTERGVGLLVLGGPEAFGAGGYRRSRLEQLLPVVATPARSTVPLTALVLLDTSGSTARGGSGVAWIERAAGAVASVAGALEPGDRLGVIGFDVQRRELLPVTEVVGVDGPRALIARWLARLPRGATGGTRLGPALAEAVARLSTMSGRRLLFVMSDGSWEPGIDATALVEDVRDARIEVVPVLLGGEPRDGLLERLAAAAGGGVLNPGAGPSLARALRRDLDARRHRAVFGPFDARSLTPTPLLPETAAWPPVRAFAMTRARDTAVVHVQAPGGAPLFATGVAGAGRVAVLPAGLAGWAPDWLAWSRFPALAGGLLGWLSAAEVTGPGFLSAEAVAGELRVRLETGSLTGSPEPVAVTLHGPAAAVAPTGAITHDGVLTPAGPGLLEGSLAVTAPGAVDVGVELNGRRLRASAVVDVDAELDGSAQQRLAPALEAGTVIPLDPRSPRLSSRGTPWPWLMLSLVAYVGVVVAERRLRRSPGSAARGR